MLDKLKNTKLGMSFLIVIILILVLICSFTLLFEVKEYRKQKEETQNLYYYFAGKKVDFNGLIKYDADGLISSVSAPNVTIDSEPLYYSNNNKKMILPKNMEVVQPHRSQPMSSLGKYSQIYYVGEYLYSKSIAGENRLYNCFLYDGKDLYLFIDTITIYVDDKRFDLEPFSYIEVIGDVVNIYDNKQKKYTTISEVKKNVFAYSEDYYVDLTNDNFTYGDKYYLLIKNVDQLKLYTDK